MKRVTMAFLVAGLMTGANPMTGATGALAQSGTIPIERDLRRAEEVDRRAGGTGSVESPTLRTQSDPTGVPGFTGPPGTFGDSVNSYGALPPGAPGNESR